jgi:hypothetical protein
VTAVCRSELAFFDLTNYEPAVMLLLGIRAAVRRGVTVCSIGRAHQTIPASRIPFYFKDIRVLPHYPAAPGERDEDRLIRAHEEPERLLGDRAVAGLREVRLFRHHYLDLPCYDAIRQFAISGRRPARAHYHEQALMLCSFSRDYRQRNWPAVRRDLMTAILGVVDQDDSLTTVPGDHETSPQLLRTLDMYSPRLVSHALFEAILRTDFCIIDWTEWRPSVFFEFGVRLAVHTLDPVCIFEASSREALAIPATAKRDDHSGAGREETAGHRPGLCPGVAAQCRGLGGLFAPIEYSCGASSPDPTAPYREMIHRHLRQKEGGVGEGPIAEGALAPGFTYRTVWGAIDPRAEAVTDSVVEFLRQAGSPLLIDQTEGRSPFIYPANHELSRITERTGRERLVAAWLYLHHRLGPAQLRTDREQAEAYNSLGTTVAEILINSPESNDRSFGHWIRTQLQEFGLGGAGG